MAKAKKVKNKNTKTKISKTKEPEFNRSKAVAKFLAKQSVEIENSLQMVSNSIIEPKGLSSGILQIDWLFGGRFLPGLHSIAGEEQSGKSTIESHIIANAYSVAKLPYICLQDSEGSVSPKYTGNIWEPFGMDVNYLLSKKGREEGFFYFRNNIIEKCFDYIKRTLSMLPDKLWCSEAGSWAYYFPKRDDKAKALIQAMQLKIDKTLSGTSPFYVCLTDNDGPEGFIAIDSFAAMLTRDEEEKEDSTKGKRSALEAAAFSEHLKRIKVDIFEKKIVLVGTNQLGSHVRAVYGSPDDQCFTGNTPVVLEDGSTITIRQVVNNRLPVKVLSFDPETGKVSAKKVTNWFNNGYASKKDFLKFGYRTFDRLGRKQTRYITCTKNHKIWSNNEWVKAGNLQVGSSVYTYVEQDVFNSDQESLLVASLLGDGQFTHSGSLFFRVTWSHSSFQRPYLYWKLDVMGIDDYHINISGTKSRVTYTPAVKGQQGASYKSHSGGYFNKKWSAIIDSVYDKEKQSTYRLKSTTGNIINRLSLKSLAIWYMDDGYSGIVAGQGLTSRISCKRFTQNERELLADKIAELTGIPRKFICARNSAITIDGVANARKFHEIIAPYVIPSMSYKLYDPSLAGTYEWEYTQPKTKIKLIETEIKSINPPDEKSKFIRRYDIEVEDNHTYFVGSDFGGSILKREDIKTLDLDRQSKGAYRKEVKALISGGLAVSNSYEKGGNALKYYSDGRARTFSRSPSAGAKHGPFTYDKDSAKFGIEDSVEYKGTDRYAYKEVKNTKNKFGKPGLKTLIRVWVSDARGKPRGVDPVFDVWMHLRNTGQLGKDGKGFKFRLKQGVGKKRADLFNSLAPFKFPSFKKLIIAEYTNNNDLLREALKELGLNVKPDLRNALFKQMVDHEEEVYSNIRDASKTESEDMEDDDVEDYEEV